jgi:hypothetical protein
VRKNLVVTNACLRVAKQRMEFGRVDRRLHTEFGDPCGQRRYEVSESFRAVLAMELRRTVWGQDSFLLRERSQRETGCVFGCLIGQPLI